MRGVRRNVYCPGIDPFLKAALPTRIPKRHGQGLHRRAPGFPPSDTGAGTHMSCERTGNRRSQTATREAGNRPAVISVPPSSSKPAGERTDRYAGGVQPHHGCAPFWLRHIRWVSVKARARMSCNRRNGYCVQGTAPPLAPMSHLLDCGTSAATRGSPARDPTVPMECNDHGSVSRGKRRDGRHGQKRTDSNCSSRRAEAAAKSPAGSCPLLKRQESFLPRHEDDAPVFRSSNDSSTRNGRPANRPSRRINSSAGQATPLAGEAGVVSPPP
jgi:hypothetical protein